MSAAELSAIVVTPDRFETVRRTVKALARQDVASRMEVVIVGPARADLAVIEEEIAGFASVRFVTMNPVRSTAEARAAGIRAAEAPVVAIVEDHCFPGRGWASALIARHREDWTGVGPTMRNANPRTLISWANFLIEYGPWAEPPGNLEPGHIPGHNSSYKKAPLLAYGDALPAIFEAESAMQWELGAKGHRFCIEPAARAFHLNYSLMGPSLQLRFLGGRLFAGNRARQWSAGKRAAYFLGSPLIPLVRFARLARLVGKVGSAPKAAMLLPILALFLAVDAFGEMVGYALGTGDVMRQLTEREFHRERFLAPGDRSATAHAPEDSVN